MKEKCHTDSLFYIYLSMPILLPKGWNSWWREEMFRDRSNLGEQTNHNLQFSETAMWCYAMPCVVMQQDYCVVICDN